MKNWKKGCAGFLAAAMTVSTVIPGSGLTVNAQDGAETAETGSTAEALEPKYAMDFEDSLSAYGTDASSLNVWKATSGSWSQPTVYEGAEVYTEGVNGGRAIDLTSGYGVILDNVKTDETYTVSLYVKQNEDLDWAQPVCAVSENDPNGNWFTLAGGSATQYQLWTSIRGNHSIGEYFDVSADWTQYTMVEDGESLKLYENGVLIRSEEDVKIDVFGGFRVMLGVNYWDPTPGCYIDELKIYDEALSDEQAAALYNGEEKLVIEEPTYTSVGKGRDLQLNAKVLNGEDVTVNWSSLNDEIATVDASGLVTGVSEGTATIQAQITAGEATLTDTVDILVGTKIADFDFDDQENGFSGAGAVADKRGNVQLAEGEDGTNALSLNGTDAWLNVTKENGEMLLTGLNELTVSFDSYSEKEEGSWSFFAAPNADAQTFGQENYVAAFDNVTSLSLEYYHNGRGNWNSTAIGGNYETGWKHVDFVINKTSVALYIDGEKVADGGFMTPLSELLGSDSVLQIGKGNWSAGEYFSGQIDNYRIYNYAMSEEELNFVETESITVSGGNSVEVGSTLQLSAEVVPENATKPEVTWSSDAKEIATVDETGKVTGVTAGTATITAAATDGSGVYGSITVTVKPVAVTSVSIEGEAARTMEVGDKLTLAANVMPENAANKAVEWSSDKPEVATVDTEGNVVAMAAGNTTITATSADNEDAKASVTITVNEKMYTVTVTDGQINGSDSNTIEVAYMEPVTVTADSETDAGKFVYWQDENGNIKGRTETYTLYVVQDVTLTPVYSEEEVEETASMSCSAYYDYAAGKFVFTAARSIPSSLCPSGKVLEHGVLLTDKEDIGTDEAKLIYGKSGVKRSRAKTTFGLLGTYIARLTDSSDTTYYARGYARYYDAEGEIVTVYSDIVSCHR